MVGERLLVGWGLSKEPTVLLVISVLELEPGMGLSTSDESHRIPSTFGLIIMLDRRAASQQ